MKKLSALFLTGFILIFFSASCGTLPALPFLSAATLPPADGAPALPTNTYPPPPTVEPSLTPVPTSTAIPTATITPSPTVTPRVYQPSAPGTPFVDQGFAPFTLENAPQLKVVFQAMRADVRQAVPSRDGTKLFVSTSNGLFVFDQSGKLLAHWLDIFTTSHPCQRCLDVNRDGSRFAVAARSAGQWQVTVYAVDGNWAIPKLAFPVEKDFLGADNEARVAFSPDDLYLAYSAGASALRVFNLQTGLQVFSVPQPPDDILFTPDGALFIIRQARNLLFYSTTDWGTPSSLLLPAENTPFTVSPDGKLLAITFGHRLRIYSLETRKSVLEFNQPPGGEREWRLSFLNGATLQGVGVEWNPAHSLATVTFAEWDAQTGQVSRLETQETDSPSPFPPQWNMNLPLDVTTSGLNIGDYRSFRFLSDGMVLINSANAVCWLKFISAEQNCLEDPEHLLFSTDSTAYKEITGDRTILQSWKGETILDVGAYRIAAIDRMGEWLLVDLNGLGTDLYAKNKTLPEESVGGAFQNYAESINWLAFTTQQKTRTFIITIIDKTSGSTLAQEKAEYLLEPLLMRRDGTLLLLKRDVGTNQVVVNSMEPPKYDIKELTRLSLPARINQMIASAREDMLALALEDGSVVLYSPDFSASASFQAFDAPVTAISFSPDGRFIAAASRQGIKIFAAMP